MKRTITITHPWRLTLAVALSWAIVAILAIGIAATATATGGDDCTFDGESGFTTVDGSCMTASVYSSTFSTENVLDAVEISFDADIAAIVAETLVDEPTERVVSIDAVTGPTVAEVLSRYWFSLSL